MRAKVDPAAASRELLAFADSYDDILKANVTKNADLNFDCDPVAEPEDLDRVFFDLDNVEHDFSDTATAPRAKCEACKHCLACAFKLMNTYPVIRSTYNSLYKCYKYVLTLPTTQVSCERVFSIVKLVKTRLRSTLRQDLFEALIFMHVKRALSFTIGKDKIINEFAASSEELKRLLLV